MMSFRNYAPTVAAFCLLLGGCGGSSSTPSTTSDGDLGAGGSVLTGVFVDSAVEGVAFATETQSGTTNTAGEYSYLAGEQVTFSIGTMQLPTIAADAQVSPVDMGETTSNPAATTTNIARLLQSLDQDGNSDNGITIPETAAAVSASINFEVSTENFENDPAVINLVANSGSVTTTLISAEDANAHLNSTLGRSYDGLWIRNPASSTESGLADYSFVDGLNFTRYNSTMAGCYTISTNTATLLGNNRYELITDNGPVSFTLNRVGEALEVTFDGEPTLVYPPASGTERDTLPICDADGNNLDSSSVVSDEEVVLDLRGSVWIVSHNPGRCPTAGDQQTLRYSQSRFSGEGISYDENCDTSFWSWDNSFAEAEAGSGFMFLCGGDALCTYEEINRSVSLTADDPRNGCKDADGQSRQVTRLISHEPGSNYFEYTHCPNDDGYRGRYVRQ